MSECLFGDGEGRGQGRGAQATMTTSDRMWYAPCFIVKCRRRSTGPARSSSPAPAPLEVPLGSNDERREPVIDGDGDDEAGEGEEGIAVPSYVSEMCVPVMNWACERERKESAHGPRYARGRGRGRGGGAHESTAEGVADLDDRRRDGDYGRARIEREREGETCEKESQRAGRARTEPRRLRRL